MERTPVEFWFDPACPWAWLTSRWVIEASRVRDLDVTWRLISLAFLNEGSEPSDRAREGHEASHRQLRVIAAARAQAGPEIVLPLYTSFGTSNHIDRRTRDRSVAAATLAAAGLGPELADAMEDERWDDDIRRDHDHGLARVGADVGTPIIALSDTAFFGPVVTPSPRGDAAGQLWDGVLAVARTPGFYELKRTRDEGPKFD